MKTVVVYCSRSGNTKKVAQAIAEVLETAARSVGEEIKLEDCDLICVGSGVHAGRPERGMMKFLRGLPRLDGKKGAVFGTYASQRGFLDTMAAMLAEKGVDVLGKWGCRGKFLFFNRRRPDEKDLEDARQFARKLKEAVTQGKES